MKTILFALLLSSVLLTGTTMLYGQDREAGDSSMLDFWIGNWDLEWDDPGGKTGHGINRVHRILDEKVVYENFIATSGVNEGFTGKSWSVYNRQSGRWKQTWVDNNGAYLDFDGYMMEDRVIFSRDLKLPDGREISQRMVFRDITKDRLVWDWEVSQDGGKTWNLNWQIRYKRTE